VTTTFGTTNVNIHAVAAAVELSDGTTALTRRLRSSALARIERQDRISLVSEAFRRLPAATAAHSWLVGVPCECFGERGGVEQVQKRPAIAR
jgi:hypothetical protein